MDSFEYFEDIPSHLQLEILEFLDCKSKCNVALSCSRMHIFVEELEKCTPQLINSSLSLMKEECSSAAGLVKNVLGRLRSRPDLALVFYNEEIRPDWIASVEALLPSDITVLAACSSSIQTNAFDQVSRQSDTKADLSIMLGSFPEAVYAPFSVPESCPPDEIYSCIQKSLLQQRPEEEASFWKVFIVYAGGRGGMLVESATSCLQNKHPGAAVIGGVCDSMDVSSIKSTGDSKASGSSVEQGLKALAWDFSIQNVQSGVVGLALGGNVPLRSCVSRGVKPLATNGPCIVESVSIVEHSDETYPYRHDAGAVHVITAVKRPESTAGQASNPTANWLQECLGQDSRPQFLGISKKKSDGFSLLQLRREMFVQQGLALFPEYLDDHDSGSTSNESSKLLNCELEIFALDPAASSSDLKNMLTRLKVQLANEFKQIMGCLMFSCAARGPEPGLVQEAVMDASYFKESFPQLPLCGFYAGGEIGPRAMALVETGAFQTGHVAVQGFTVVFGVFCVPLSEMVRPEIETLDAGVPHDIFCERRRAKLKFLRAQHAKKASEMASSRNYDGAEDVKGK